MLKTINLKYLSKFLCIFKTKKRRKKEEKKTSRGKTFNGLVGARPLKS